MWEVLTFFALFLTLLAVLWYAWETKKLRMEAVKQTELSLRPLIILLYDEGSRKFNYKNIGNGTALDVYLDEIPIVKAGGQLYIRYIFDSKDILVPEKEIEVTGEIKINEGVNSSFHFMSHFSPSSAVKSYEFSINYRNMNDEPYVTKGIFGQGGIRTNKTERIK